MYVIERKEIGSINALLQRLHIPTFKNTLILTAMSASPSAHGTASAKRPLEDESSPSGPTDQPDAKRPALDKVPATIGLGGGDAKPEPISQPQSPNAADAQEPANVPTQNGQKDPQGDTVVPDAPNGAGITTSAMLETQPIQSTGGQYDRATSHGASHQGHQDETGWLHIRAVISSAEAATVIGKGGENVSQIRRHSGAKCTVSDYSKGAVERVLTVSGLVDAAAKVIGLQLFAFTSTNYMRRLLVSSYAL